MFAGITSNIVKYFVYNYLWRLPGDLRWSVGTDLITCKSVTEVFEHSVTQEHIRSIQCIEEISKLEYKAAKKRRLLA